MKYQLQIYTAKDVNADDIANIMLEVGPPDRIELMDPPRDNADLGEGCTLHTYIRNTEDECNDLLAKMTLSDKMDTYIFTYTPTDEAFHLAEKLANAE